MLGSFGFDASGMDRSIAAGDDFFGFANGTWVKNTEIPADRSRFGSFNVIAEKTLADTRAILEGAAGNAQASGDDKLIGDYYAAYMDEAGIEQHGIAPVQPQLKAIDAIADKAGLARTLGGDMRADVDLLNATNFYTDRLFGLWVSVDMLQPDRNAPYLVQGGLGMPDRDFYLGDGRMAELRKQYQAYIAQMLQLAGVADPAGKAQRILALETKIAQAHVTQEETNDVTKGANPWTQADFNAKAPGMDWNAFLDAAALGNAQRAELFEYQRNIAKLGKPVDHSEWAMLPQTINAMNVPLENRLVFPAAILQPPFFDGAADDAVNYGAIGAVIGHEISHGFDNAGALFDETGKLHNWWTAEDLKQFNAAGDALAAQFSSYAPFPGVHVNGKLTLGENIADVAGLGTAYDAYQLSLQGKPGQTLEGFTPDQRFFLGFAQAWRSKSREQALRNSLLTDVHAPGQFRALTVRNIDAWYPAFEVKEGQKLYLAPDKRVKVW